MEHFLLPRDRVRLVVTQRLVGIPDDLELPAGALGWVINAPEQHAAALVRWDRYGDHNVSLYDLHHATFLDLLPPRLRSIGVWVGREIAKATEQVFTVALTAAVTVAITLLVQHFFLAR